MGPISAFRSPRRGHCHRDPYDAGLYPPRVVDYWPCGYRGGRHQLAAVTNVVVPMGTFLAVAAVQRQGGDTFNAAFTLTSRAELISVGLLYGLSACIGAVTGQNGGAGREDRQ